MRRILAISVLAVFSSLVYAQDVKVTAAFDSSKIFIGDQIHFTVTIDKPAGESLVLPVLRDTLVKQIEILRGPVTDSAKLKDGWIRVVRKYLVTSFDSGFYQVPPQYAEKQTASGMKRYYSDYTPLQVLRVKITPPDSTMKIFDIVKPYKAPLTAEEVLPWVLLAIVLTAVVWYVIRLINRLRRKRNGGEETVLNPDPAHVIALRALEKLREEELWQKGHVKQYYTRLTEIVRLYLENRYNIQSLELTTPETLALVKKSGFKEDELFVRLRTILTGADLVKFAKYNPDASENELHYDYAWDFVSLTRKVEAPEEAIEVQPENRETL